MPKKYSLIAVAALVAALSAGVAALLVRRSRNEHPPVSATVPRIEELRGPSDDSAPAAS
ncbi:hypothetical protein AAFP35_04230 [Gordonia sp. CPCC 206044]|uniref:hypothetical protein n=1 Tax=Gordonia sp. CPCC 206044 TaxID=3140793 RepID=UPI003AF37888